MRIFLNFLFSIEILKLFSDQNLKLCYKHLEIYLKQNNSYDLDGNILF